MHYPRESIITSTIRSFFRSFAVFIGFFTALMLILFGLISLSSPYIQPEKSTLLLSPDAKGQRQLIGPTSDVILKLDISGIIGIKNLTTEKITSLLIDAQEGVLKNDRVKAVVLYINTPGGTVTDSDGIYRAIMNFKTKHKLSVYAYVDGMCASGGMYIACAADKVFASSNSVIGSVGVRFGPAFNFSTLMQCYGVEALTITQGKDKDALNPFRPWKEDEDLSYRNLTSAMYQQFVNLVTSARPALNKQKLISDYGAHVFISEEALEYGYIDVANSSYNETLEALASRANLESYQVMTIQLAHNFLSELSQARCSFIEKMSHLFSPRPHSLHPELEGKFLYLYQPGQLL
ncbi:Peptidase family S49 [Candidatus Rhabdochlamydia oedothoracis]|uniref:Peptidase family S49 n=1 Tax=Candidatus Rhabdochlamydia oedothoracis TaxID=2720720 RepID=A0ABX8V2S9_9BACT|nr:MULTISPECIES: S49 family peptidase [Rhabdochlamydia]KAG6559178.1 putative signal peptide peptidase SppA [Candidatus Rhabdochlamydia sp. W815]QYF49451.1 Peptidase family S49 [Candidatus Rhabdochlamydia oedothoracis]